MSRCRKEAESVGECRRVSETAIQFNNKSHRVPSGPTEVINDGKPTVARCQIVHIWVELWIALSGVGTSESVDRFHASYHHFEIERCSCAKASHNADDHI